MAEKLNETLGTYNSDEIIYGGVMPIVTDTVTLTSGSSYVKGSVLGIITATSKAKLVDSTATDGSKSAQCVLAQDVDATTEDMPAVVYMTGEFKSGALVFGGSDTEATHKESLRKLGIFIKKAQQ